MNRLRRLKLVLWSITGLALAVATARFLFGLGPVTHLSDAFPWGLWIGFDVMGGVALAAGGFILTATVYIFHLERFHSIVRPAVATAFLGYAAVAVGLLFDLGLPWNIWHMLVFWNPHSPLFEVGWCVMLYLTVLLLEFLPVPTESLPKLRKLYCALLKVRLPLVILGIGLSTLHQSSLGSLFLIMPFRVHPLWYSPALPLLFLTSAIALGLMMVVFESHCTSYFYGREPETDTLASLGSVARYFLAGYLVLRFADLIIRGDAHYLAAPGWHTFLFWLEVTFIAVPALLFSLQRVRTSHSGQFAAAFLGVAGIVFNRIDVGGLAHLPAGAPFYFPAWTEIAITAGVVSTATLVFLFLIERFNVWEQRPVDPEAAPLEAPRFHPVGTTWLGTPAVASRTIYSLAFVLAAALGFALLAPRPAFSRGIPPQPVHRARGGDILWIDGNLNGYGVAFPHAKIEAKLGGDSSCVKCHHMNLPRDRNSGCYECHRDMYLPTDAFRHDWHAAASGANLSCNQCHTAAHPRTASNVKTCGQCHKDLIPPGATIQVKTYQTVGYVEAMHTLCIGCHVNLARQNNKPGFAQCTTCHKEPRPLDDAAAQPKTTGVGILLPAYAPK